MPWNLSRSVGSVTFASQPLQHRLAAAARRLPPLPRAALRRLLIGTPVAQLPEGPFPLHFPLQVAERCVDVIVADECLHGRRGLCSVRRSIVDGLAARPRRPAIAT